MFESTIIIRENPTTVLAVTWSSSLRLGMAGDDEGLA